MADRELMETVANVPVWDVPTRLFHWVLVALVLGSYTSAQLDAMQVHKWCGLAILTLLLFRLMWGFAGGRHARFSAFVRGPATVLACFRDLMKKSSARFIGHNPLGGWSVVFMLIFLLIQACTGLFANDDAGFEGPLARHVDKETSDFFSHLHSLNIDIVYVLVALHVAAILFYLFKKRENLVKPMISGYKSWHRAVEESPPAHGSVPLAAVLLVIAAGVVYFVVR